MFLRSLDLDSSEGKCIEVGKWDFKLWFSLRTSDLVGDTKRINKILEEHLDEGSTEAKKNEGNRQVEKLLQMHKGIKVNNDPYEELNDKQKLMVDKGWFEIVMFVVIL